MAYLIQMPSGRLGVLYNNVIYILDESYSLTELKILFNIFNPPSQAKPLAGAAPRNRKQTAKGVQSLLAVFIY